MKGYFHKIKYAQDGDSREGEGSRLTLLPNYISLISNILPFVQLARIWINQQRRASSDTPSADKH